MIINKKVRNVEFPKRQTRKRGIGRNTLTSMQRSVDTIMHFANRDRYDRRLQESWLKIADEYTEQANRIVWRHKQRPIKRLAIGQTP